MVLRLPLGALPAAALAALGLFSVPWITGGAFATAALAAPLRAVALAAGQGMLDAASVPVVAFSGPAALAGALPGGLDVGAAEAQFLDLLNADRTAAGLNALQADPRLMDLARWRSEDMVNRNYFSHDIGGIIVGQVLKDRNIPFRLAGENLADTTYDDARTVPNAESGLMRSPGHRDNILRPEFNAVGVGIAAGPDGRVVLTQIFIQT